LPSKTKFKERRLMLWSLIKILLFVTLVGAGAMAAGYLMDAPGGVQVTVSGTEYTLAPLQSVLVALAMVLAVWVGLALISLMVAVLRFISGDETAISRYFDRGRERRGYQALTDAMMALASGDGRSAVAKAARAERYLRRPELTDLLTAQAAEMAGDGVKASETYKRLIGHDATRFVGVRGIMKQKLAEGDTDTALKLAEKAFALKPKHEDTQDVLLKLQAQAADWSGARATLNAKLKSGTLPRDIYTRRAAVLALSEASSSGADSDVDVTAVAIEANRLSPDLVPAAVLAARAYIAKGKARNALRVILKAWEAQPHPDLAAAFAEIKPDETPRDRLERFKVLIRIQPDHPETRLLQAELHLVAEDFPGARRAMGDLVASKADARALTLMAAIERGEGASDKVVRGWLARAVTARRGPQWICDTCHHAHDGWAPVCVSCDSFDTLGWRAPSAATSASMTGVDMMPLLMSDDDAPNAIVPNDQP
jgi:HemY protein